MGRAAAASKAAAIARFGGANLQRAPVQRPSASASTSTAAAAASDAEQPALPTPPPPAAPPADGYEDEDEYF